MNDVRKEELIRLSMQRELTAEEERAVSRAIQSLPNVPVSSNFTSRVLQAVEMEETAEKRKERSDRRWFRFLFPRVGWALAVAALVAFGIYYRPGERPRPEDVLVSLPIDFAKLPAPDVLADFDAINHLRQASVMTDDKLLEALQ